MKIVIQTLGFEARKKLINLIDEKVQKLSQISDRIIEAEVHLKDTRSDKKENAVCEIKLIIPGNDLFASRQTHKFEEAVSETVDALKQQLTSWKERSQHT